MNGHWTWKTIGALAVAAALAAAPPGSAQTSPTCQSAIAALLGLRITLEEEKAKLRRCRRGERSSCAAEQGRIRELELQRRLVRNYLERYCAR